MQRRVRAELLDDDLGTPADLADSLRDLNHVNDWFGGTRATTRLLRRIAGQCGAKELSLLEIGAGLGHVPLAARRRLAQNGPMLQVTLLDRLWTHLPRNGVPAVSGDAMRLPFCDGAFDVVSCSLLAHHFTPDSLPSLCAEALRVARRAVLINDLIRSRLHLVLAHLALPMFRNHITRHDGIASVRAAYTVAEMKSLLRQVPARDAEFSRHFLFRMGVVLWK
jgi:SAM-dependent methyltransferase